MQPSLLPMTITSAWTPTEPPDLSRYDTIELDLETDGIDPFRGSLPCGFAVGYGDQRQYLPIRHKGGGNLDEATVKRWFEREVRGKRIRNIYTQFDMLTTRAWGVDLAAQENTFHDVSHSAALLDDHRRVFTLDALAQNELGIGKLDSGPKSEIADLPAGVIAPYATRDIELVAKLAAVYDPQIRAQGLGRVAALEDAILPVVAEMTWNGVHLDEELLSQWEHETRHLEEQLAWQIARECGIQVNPDGPASMTKLFEFCKVPILHRTASGQASFTAEIMQEAALQHPLIGKVYALGKIKDLRNKYFVKYAKDLCRDGKLHPTFNQLKTDDAGTVSGRFSSARPNIQQVMAADKHKMAYGPVWKLFGLAEDSYMVKRLFVPGPGAEWFCADQEQVEYRIATHYTKSKRMIATYRADPVKRFIKWMNKEAWIAGPQSDYHAIVGEMVTEYRPNMTRTEVKIINFLSIFGGGTGALVRKLGISDEDAQELRQQYFTAFPEMKTLLYEAKQTAERRGYVMTRLGRRARFPGKQRSHKALNAIVQGSAADDNKSALVALYESRRSLGLTMRITVHDEFDGDLTGPVAPVLELLNTQRLGFDVPILWSGNTGRNWAEAK